MNSDYQTSLQKAYNESIKDNKKVYMSLLTNLDDTILPKSLKNTGDITLDISPKAIRNLDFSSKYVEFQATFDGVVETISIPYDAVIALIETPND